MPIANGTPAASVELLTRRYRAVAVDRYNTGRLQLPHTSECHVRERVRASDQPHPAGEFPRRMARDGDLDVESRGRGCPRSTARRARRRIAGTNPQSTLSLWAAAQE